MAVVPPKIFDGSRLKKLTKGLPSSPVLLLGSHNLPAEPGRPSTNLGKGSQTRPLKGSLVGETGNTRENDNQPQILGTR
ncbi:hypothetical protein GE21DRAFT_1304960 [Neurospora crassa]|nr:hypothetical protein GE21DRAFT_1304960 [Neurospora crassa]